MRHLFLIIFCMILHSHTLLLAQQAPFFETTFYVKDAIGNVDSVQIGFDPLATLGDTQLFNSTLNNMPFDSVFDIRVTLTDDGDYYDRMINPAYTDEICTRGGHYFIMIWAKHQPVTIYWDKAAFQANCFPQALFTPDRLSYSVEPWIWSENANSIFACAALSDSMTCNLYTEPMSYPDGSGGFDPIIAEREVEGEGTQLVTGIYFTFSFAFGPCLISSTDHPILSTEKASIFPNPGIGQYRLQNGRQEPFSIVTVVDIWGKVVRSYADGQPELVDITGLPTGIYTVAVRWKDGYQKAFKVVLAE